MAGFTRKLTVTKIDERLWMVEVPFSFEGIRVDSGFVTDFASSPRWSWWLVPPDGEYSQACVLHDKLYQSHEMSRKDSDKALYRAMKCVGVPKWKRGIMYWAVRLFGYFAWKAYDPVKT